MPRSPLLVVGVLAGLCSSSAFLLPHHQFPVGVGRQTGSAFVIDGRSLVRGLQVQTTKMSSTRDEPTSGAGEPEAVIEDGVSLAVLHDIVQDAAFLEERLAKWLDEEWIPQDVHRELGKRAAQAYIQARQDGVTDLGQILLIVGTTMEEEDMGDAFVDAWTVANKLSDLLLSRLGREVCCAKAELTEHQEAMMEGRAELDRPATGGGAFAGPGKGGPQLLMPEMPPEFFTLESVLDAAERFTDEFNRFDFLRKFLDGHDGMWRDANLVMALLLGFRYNEWGHMETDDLHSRFRHLSLPPDFEGNMELREHMEAILAEDEDEDKMKALEEFVEVMVGKSYYHQQIKNGDEDFLCRTTLVKWVYEHDFVNDFSDNPNIKAVLDVKARITEKKNGESQPPTRYLY